MDWTIKNERDANHNPEVVVNQRPGRAPLDIDARVGTPIVLDATGTSDPDGDAVKFTWFFYPEAGMGVPHQPVLQERPPIGGGGTRNEGGIPSAPRGPREPPPRVTVRTPNGVRTEVIPMAAGTAHVILAVEDDGAPPLTSYRRMVLHVRRAS
jgi:hypothetical protein